MKKYRLKKDTVFYPKGTVIKLSDEDYYNLEKYKYYVMENDKTVTFSPWQIENNSLWEEITEDQREGECGRCESGLCSTHPPISMKDGMPTHTCDQSLLTYPPQCKQCYDENYGQRLLTDKEAKEVLNNATNPIYFYQTLREESLKEYWDIKIEPTELEKISCVKLYIKEKYADAWRDLLDKE